MYERGVVIKFKWRKSYDKKDSKNIAEYLHQNYDVSPYSLKEAGDLIRAAAKSGELQLKKAGRSYSIEDPQNWFLDRVKPNTVTLDRQDYLRAMANGLELLTLGNLAKTDFGGARQREFGQQWTDFIRGYLGEIAVKTLMADNWDTEVRLKQRDTGSGVEAYLPTDVVRIKEDEEFRNVNTTLSIKTSKLGSLWLAIPKEQLSQPDSFTFVKIGIPLDHLATFLKEIGGIEKLFEEAEGKDEWRSEEVSDAIDSFKPIPAYIPGFAWVDDFKNGQLKTNKATKYMHIVGGIGKKPESPPSGLSGIKVRSLQDPNEEYLGSCGALRWNSHEWKSLIDSM